MAKKKSSKGWGGLNLDIQTLDVAESWYSKGFDVEEFYVPDVGAENFIVGEEEESNEHECRYIRPHLNPIPRRHVKYEKAANLASELGLLKVGERVDLITSGLFIFGDFIEAYFVENDLHAKRLLISTLSYNENNVDSLRNLLDGGYVDRIDMVVSDYFYAYERHQLVKYAYQELDDESGRFQLAVCRLHSKTYQFVTDEGLHIIMSGSSNMHSGANIEQMTLEENEETYRFYEKFYDEILEGYKTIDTSKKYDKNWFKTDFDDKGEQ